MPRESITILQPLPKPEAKGGCAPSDGSAKIPLWLVMGRNNKDEPWHPCAAYGTKIQAEVYASGCSDKDRMKIVAGLFSPNAAMSDCAGGKLKS